MHNLFTKVIQPRQSLKAWVICALLPLVGCATTPTSIVQQPTTARTPVAGEARVTSGAIFNNASFRPLAEDRRPRYVGDIVTVNLAENTTVTRNTGNSASKDGEIDASIGSFLGRAVPRGTVSAGSSSSFQDRAASNAGNVFRGAITATVVEVLPNGNLVISGEKQIGLDRGTEFMRFSGVVNPDLISLGNHIMSTQIADARIEYRTNSKLDAAEIGSMFARFFLSLSPL